MQKLWSLVEESGVVLIAFDDELGAIGHGETGAEIFRNSTHQKRWIAPCILEDPSRHAGGCGLAMSPRNHQGVVATDEFLVNQFRHGDKGDALIEQVLKLRIAARNGIADHHHVGSRDRDCCSLKGSQTTMPSASRNVDIGGYASFVGAAHIQSPCLQHAGQRGHGRTADSDQMDATCLHQCH